MISALVRPIQLALLTGKADSPPPRSRFLRFPVRLGPIRHIDLVRVGAVLLAWWVCVVTANEMLHLNRAIRVETGVWPVTDLSVYVTALALSAPIAICDRWPMGAWRLAILMLPQTVSTVSALNPRDDGFSYPLALVVMYPLVLYVVARRQERGVLVAIWLISLAVIAMLDSPTLPQAAIILAAPLLIGYNIRGRKSTAVELAQVSQAQAVLEERSRIARELHDVVAHHMSVIAIQAEAVPLQARGDAERLERGLAEIRALSLEAIAELRQVLGVLRDGEGRTDTAPQPGLDRLEELVANARGAGLRATLERGGSMRVAPAVGLSVYRIVQESLSNVMRHAPGARVTVRVTRTPVELRVRVSNGPGVRPGTQAGAGHGLIGMRERVAMLNGTLEAGPSAYGFKVEARIPLEAA
ncbi:sensor histidine kinase [Nonomuraea longicatena]|uniref:histidine kinase n=1 Tax=Nonomuraea longicatena TaxID=83682 RepID=A0ABN1QGH6_9ACTN